MYAHWQRLGRSWMELGLRNCILCRPRLHSSQLEAQEVLDTQIQNAQGIRSFVSLMYSICHDCDMIVWVALVSESPWPMT